jgi:hypothetical protein
MKKREYYAERYFRERGIDLDDPAVDRTNPHCCFMGCGKPPEWSIYDQGDNSPDAGTDACTAHVGELLGRRPDLVPLGRPWAFTVVPYAAEPPPNPPVIEPAPEAPGA